MFTRIRWGFLILAILAASASAAEPTPNQWAKMNQAVIEGQRYDIPLTYAPEVNRFMVLGGRTHSGEYPKPRSYDELALDRAEGKWENWFPTGKNWGPKFGPCMAPKWPNETFGFKDTEGNIRPNWTIYGTFSIGQKFDYDTDKNQFVFYAGGQTFSYDPAARKWKDLNPPTNPEKTLGGTLLWSSMCYDQHNKQFVLFGGGNIQSERGDPGTWTYSPASNAWTQLDLDQQPPARANSRLVYDPIAKKVVLFGGDQLDQLLADTWTLDVVARKWEEKKPAIGPGPRAGHALLWLPKAKKVLLLGGYAYNSSVEYGGYRALTTVRPMEAWLYDTTGNRWQLVKHFVDAKKAPQGPWNAFLSAAVNEEDLVVVLADGTWRLPVDAAKTDRVGTTKFGVKPGAVVSRTGPYDPQWYRHGIPAADPAKLKADLKNLPVNQWALRPTPKRPSPNMDWGSAVFSPELDLIMRFSGGHSAYSGTAPQVYDVKTDRYSIPFAPEQPLEYIGSNDQIGGEWSFKGNPWMTGHTYKSTGYDPNLKCMVFVPHKYTYFFDPKTGKWTRSAAPNPYRPNFYSNTVCSTPSGAVVWATTNQGQVGLWRLDSANRTWKVLPLKGTLPDMAADDHGMAYDSQRDRLLFFSRVGKNKGNVATYDPKTGTAKWLDSAGKDQAAVPSRETIYLPEFDMVMIGARVPNNGKSLWLLYDCAKNAFMGAELPGADPIGKGTVENVFNNSMGLMYDPNRKLVWAVGQNSHVHVLRFDANKARLVELK